MRAEAAPVIVPRRARSCKVAEAKIPDKAEISQAPQEEKLASR